jgi:hypothetical protein
MQQQADNEHADERQADSTTTYYGPTRMQQMSGGTTPAGPPDPTDTDVAARIAQLHGVGNALERGDTRPNSDQDR